MNKRYYKVKCKCGHVGRNYYIPIDFPVVASNGREAAKIARNFPRCKHHHKDCILEVVEISKEDYVQLQTLNDEDPFLHCHSIQQQRLIVLENRKEPEIKKCPRCVKEEIEHKVFDGKTKIRKPKMYIRFSYLMDNDSSLFCEM